MNPLSHLNIIIFLQAGHFDAVTSTSSPRRRRFDANLCLQY